MARYSIRNRFVVSSLASTLLGLVLFAAGSFVVVWLGDADADIRAGDSFRGEAAEMIFGAMAVAAPLALGAALVTAAALSRRSTRSLERAITAARETTAHDLRRNLPVPARDDELRELVIALNELFVRLDDGFGALARFAADASHELRTPLAVMATELEVALRHPRPIEEWEATGRVNLDELRRMSAVVEGLLTLARVGSDAPTSHAAVPLTECVETAIRNLVENAIAAVARHGSVRVSVDASTADDVIVQVDDDGPGLGADPEALFAPFLRGSHGRADTAAHTTGVGLGLAIARRIARAHGGQLDAGSSPLGGARFTLTIPRGPRT
jgi:signal transduction histidine kinase